MLAPIWKSECQNSLSLYHTVRWSKFLFFSLGNKSVSLPSASHTQVSLQWEISNQTSHNKQVSVWAKSWIGHPDDSGRVARKSPSSESEFGGSTDAHECTLARCQKRPATEPESTIYTSWLLLATRASANVG